MKNIAMLLICVILFSINSEASNLTADFYCRNIAGEIVLTGREDANNISNITLRGSVAKTNFNKTREKVTTEFRKYFLYSRELKAVGYTDATTQNNALISIVFLDEEGTRVEWKEKAVYTELKITKNKNQATRYYLDCFLEIPSSPIYFE